MNPHLIRRKKDEFARLAEKHIHSFSENTKLLIKQHRECIQKEEELHEKFRRTTCRFVPQLALFNIEIFITLLLNAIDYRVFVDSYSVN
jgi:hypothetical protein